MLLIFPAKRWNLSDQTPLAGVFSFGAGVTALEMVVDDAHGLHEGVAGGGADEFPAAFLEGFGKGYRGL